MRETWVWSLGWEELLEKGKASHSSILAWGIPWTVHGVTKRRTHLSDCCFHFTSLSNVTFSWFSISLTGIFPLFPWFHASSFLWLMMFDVTQNSVFSHYTNSGGQIPIHCLFAVNKVLLEQSHAHSFCLWVLLCYSRRDQWPTKPTIFPILSFAEKVWAAFALGDLILSLKRQCIFRFIRLSYFQWGPFCPQHINTTHTSSVPLPSFNFSSLSLYVLVGALQKNRKKKKKECVQILLRGRFILRDCLV